MFKKIEIDDKTKYNIFYTHSKWKTITAKGDIDDVFESVCATIAPKI